MLSISGQGSFNGSIEIDATLLRFVYSIQTSLICPGTYKEIRTYEEITVFMDEYN